MITIRRIRMIRNERKEVKQKAKRQPRNSKKKNGKRKKCMDNTQNDLKKAMLISNTAINGCMPLGTILRAVPQHRTSAERILKQMCLE